eukprot:gene30123-6236_t
MVCYDRTQSHTAHTAQGMEHANYVFCFNLTVASPPPPA